MPKRRRLALRLQGAYYIASGAWPLLSRRTFEAVTGPKTDWWLVQMVALLAITNGVTIVVGAASERTFAQTRMLALLSALSFSMTDIVHTARRRIRPIYLGDAVVEAALVLLGEWPE